MFIQILPENSCNSFVFLVGVTGGSHHTHTGGSPDYICLPTDPEFLHVDAESQVPRNYVYSVQYETGSFTPLNHLASFDAPCAVCRVTGRGTVLMIPAKTTCPTNWTTEYRGYLMSSQFQHVRQTEYTCLDESPEIRPGTEEYNPGGTFDVVEVRCTSGKLPCPPYSNGDELACVVCTI